MTRFPVGLLIVILLIPSAVAGAKDPAEKETALRAIPQRMSQFVKDHQISGAVTLVARDGDVVHWEAVGKADVENNQPMQKDTIFAIASMTKPITATAVMMLQDEGKLSIQDPVAKYIPQFKEAALEDDKLNREITIFDLLTHTSGLVGSQQNEGSLQATAEKLAARPLGFQPGTRWQYGPGITVCGRVVELASGQPFEVFLAKRIFEPLGMSDTTFFPSPQQQTRIARLYKPGKDKNSLEATTHWLTDLSASRTPNPSGGLFSTAGDLAKFYQMILNGGQYNGKRLVSESAVKEMTRIQTGELQTGFTPGNGWGLGWCVVRQPLGPTSELSAGTFGHGGALGTQGWVDPTRRMIFVLMIQRTEFGNSDASDIRRTFQELAVKAASNQD
jgi:CubicO group peptidase (beta-lactamase class C family)